jgi:hypothetical protein
MYQVFSHRQEEMANIKKETVIITKGVFLVEKDFSRGRESHLSIILLFYSKK